MISLWDAVSEGTGSSYNSAAITAEVSDRISMDPTSLSDYVSECVVGMVATNAALAQMEGLSVINYMKAGNSVAQEQVVATFEGFIAKAWEKIKEWVEKAYEAIKEWLRKAWGRMKQVTMYIKGLFGKYADVLKHKDLKGCKIRWVDINYKEGYKKFMDFHNKIDSAIGGVMKLIGEAIEAAKKYDNESMILKVKDVEKAKANIEETYTGANIRDTIESAIYGGGATDQENYMKLAKDEEFNSHRKDIFQATDNDAEQMLQDLLNISERDNNKTIQMLKKFESMVAGIERDMDKKRSNAMRDEIKDYDASNDDDAGTQGKALGSKAAALRPSNFTAALRAEITLDRIASQTIKLAIDRYRSMCVAACKKAIWYKPEKEGFYASVDGRTATSESAEFGDIMAAFM